MWLHLLVCLNIVKAPEQTGSVNATAWHLFQALFEINSEYEIVKKTTGGRQCKAQEVKECIQLSKSAQALITAGNTLVYAKTVFPDYFETQYKQQTPTIQTNTYYVPQEKPTETEAAAEINQSTAESDPEDAAHPQQTQEIEPDAALTQPSQNIIKNNTTKQPKNTSEKLTNLEDQIIEEVDAAKEMIIIYMFSFSSKPILSKLVQII